EWKILHEVKKSRAMEISAEWQVKYYLYYLEQKGISIEYGVLDYPKLRQRKEIHLTDVDREELQKILQEIENICQQERSPAAVRKNICNKCAYFEYCFS